MEILIVILTVITSAAAVIVSLMRHFRKSDELKCRVAAANLIREDLLNYSLNNPMNSKNKQSPPSGRMMICFKTRNAVKKQSFVFDAGKEIFIGRNAAEGNVFINDNSVSKNHCAVFSRDGTVYVRCTCSSGSVSVRHSIIDSETIYQNETAPLYSGDILIIGAAEFKVMTFYFDIKDL